MLAAGQAMPLQGGFQGTPETARHGGNVDWNTLTPAERAQIIDIDRRLRDDRTPRERCIDEQVEHHGGSPSALDWEVIELACNGR
jgi:hypothetical protein